MSLRLLCISLCAFLLLVTSGCDQPGAEPDTGNPFDIVISVPAPAPIPALEENKTETGSRLLNLKEWLTENPSERSPDTVELDYLTTSQLYEDGYVLEAVLFPSAWPTTMLGGSIPEFTGTGYMFELFVFHPNMSYRSEDIRTIIITIYKYEEADVFEYIESLDGFTRDEEKEKAKALTEIFPPEKVKLKALREYVKDDIFLSILFAEDFGDFVQFSISFTREPYVLDIENTGHTKLQNVIEFAESNPAAEKHTLVLDDHTISNVDDIGRQTDVFAHPSKWPKDVFGDLIPIYEGEGLMTELIITAPHEDPSRDKALIVSLIIEEFKLKDIEAYVRTLVNFGYHELAPEDYDEQDTKLSEERDVYNVFTLPGMNCFVGTITEENGIEKLQICLRFEGRYQNFFESLEQ